jgi:hypothetical protein
MPWKSPFYSVHEPSKPEDERVYHDHTDCGPASEIHEKDRLPGKGPNGEYRQCKDCKKAHADDKAAK